MKKPTEQELDKLWLDMSFLKDYLTNKEVYRKLTDSYHTLSKGIDELIKKYENEIGSYKHNQLYSVSDSGEQYASEQFYQREIYSDILQDLKKLKGE